LFPTTQHIVSLVSGTHRSIKVLTVGTANLLFAMQYFGILTRDCAEVAGEQIATRLGTARRMGVSVRDCALCGNELRNALSSDPTQASLPEGATSAVCAPFGDKTADGGFAASEATVQLSCKHLFHSDCIRGWTIIGKKEEW
jgi:RING finger protein 121/175